MNQSLATIEQRPILQRAFLQAMVSRGYCAQVAVGSKAAIELIEWYLQIPKITN